MANTVANTAPGRSHAPIATLHIKAKITRQGDSKTAGGGAPVEMEGGREGGKPCNHPATPNLTLSPPKVESAQTLCGGNAIEQERS